jgi:DNA repair exonuclease SbcCD nuclease subunit
MSSLEFVGVGDIHLDSKLSQHIPNINEVIMNEVRGGPIRYALRNGIKLVIFYGDICDVPKMSDDAAMRLYDLFSEYPNLKFILMTGNHDIEQVGIHSLNVLKKVCELGFIKNVRIVDKPTTFFRAQGTPVRILPWPHFSVDESAFNILHIETDGSQWDHGKMVKSERTTEAFCSSGHLHTKQVCGPRNNIFYCGTLYQTNFGEKPDKYFHHIVVSHDKATGGIRPQVTLVPHKPTYTLHNHVVSSVEDLDRISRKPTDLYKVFVKDGADLDAGTFDAFPNVVKINAFKTRSELDALLAEDLVVHDASATVNSMTVFDALSEYMVRAKVEPSLAERAESLFARLMKRASNAPVDEA